MLVENNVFALSVFSGRTGWGEFRSQITRCTKSVCIAPRSIHAFFFLVKT